MAGRSTGILRFRASFKFYRAKSRGRASWIFNSRAKHVLSVSVPRMWIFSQDARSYFYRRSDTINPAPFHAPVVFPTVIVSRVSTRRIRHRSSLFKWTPRINASNDAGHVLLASTSVKPPNGRRETQEWARARTRRRRIRHVSVSATPNPTATTRVKRAACKSDVIEISWANERFSANPGDRHVSFARAANALFVTLRGHRLEELASCRSDRDRE